MRINAMSLCNHSVMIQCICPDLRRCIVKKLFLGFFLIGFSSFVGAQTSLQVGGAACDSNNESRSCKISWNLLETPRTYYRVQQWSKDYNIWRNVDNFVANTALGTQPTSVDGGELYRVFACNDLDATRDCIGTTAFWAPSIPKTADESAKIPERMTYIDKDGAHNTMLISKNGDFKSQVIQYNVYLVIQAFANADFRELPLMTEPPIISMENRDILTLEDVIHINVYPNYNGLREQQLGSGVAN